MTGTPVAEREGEDRVRGSNAEQYTQYPLLMTAHILHTEWCQSTVCCQRYKDHVLRAHLEVGVRFASSDPVMVRESLTIVYKQVQDLILLQANLQPSRYTKI